MIDLKRLLTPDVPLSRSDRMFVALGWGLATFLVWQFVSIPFLPKPGAVLSSFAELRANGTFLEFLTSIWTMIEAMFWTITISLSFAYLSVIPAGSPPVKFIAGLRYLGLVGLMVYFTLFAPNGHFLRVMVLTFGMTVFYLRDMLVIVQSIPQERYDHAKTLGMGPVRMVYEVVILGTLAEAMESLRVNAAMGWMMLTSVEAVTLSQGGIGAVLYGMNRHMDLANEAAIMISLFCVGIGQDFLIGIAKDYIVAPYARTK